MADHPTALEISMKCGEDFTARIEWLTEDGDPAVYAGLVTIDPDNLTPIKTYATMEVRDGDHNLILQLKTGDYDPNVAPPPGKGYISVFLSGEIQLYIPWQVSASVPPGSYLFDLFVDIDMRLALDTDTFKPFGDSVRRHVCSGRFVARPYVTVPAENRD